jgi:uncharacterized protein YjiS (DUF1127 family)
MEMKMKPILQILPTSSALTATRLNRAYRWIERTRATVRARTARRTMAQLDDRTLRDIGVTRRDVAVLVVTSFRR